MQAQSVPSDLGLILAGIHESAPESTGAPQSPRLFPFARTGAVLSALIVATQLALWSEPFPIGIYLAFFESVALIPVACALHQLIGTRMSALLLAVGLACQLRYVIIAPLILAGLVSRYQEADSLRVAWLAMAGWLLGANVLAFRTKALPRWVPVLGLIAGLFLVAAAAAWLQAAATGSRTDPGAIPEALSMHVRGNAFAMIGRFFLPFWLGGIALVLGRRKAFPPVRWHRALLVEPVLVLLIVAPTVTQRPPELQGFDVQPYISGLNLHTCADFASQAEAQAALRAKPSDPNRLESRAGEGVACASNAPPHDWIPVRVAGPAVEPVYPLIGRGTLAFVALDDMDEDLFDDVVDDQERRFGLSILRLPEIAMPWPAEDRSGSLQAEKVIKRLKADIPDLANDKSVAIIAFTVRPLYQQRNELETTGPFESVYAHHEDDRLGVISTDDMGWDFEARTWVDFDRFMSRLYKYTTRYVGNLYFRIPRNDDPYSLFSRRVPDMNTVDRWREDVSRQ